MEGCDEMTTDNILAMFLKIITEYNYLEFDEEELNTEFMEMIDMAIVELQFQGLVEDIEFDVETGFSGEISKQLGYIIAHACALVWVTPKVNSSELLATALTSTDFNLFSPSNRLQSCMKLKLDMQAKLNNLITDYDAREGYTFIKKKLEDSDMK